MPGKKPSRKGEGLGRSWNLQEIRDLIDVLIERNVQEFEMEKAGQKVRIKRGSGSMDLHGFSTPPLTSPNLNWPATAPAPPAPSPGAASTEPEPGETSEGLHLIKSPIVGTFYSAPSPTAPPFVKEGDVIQVGQAVCIIEAMKLMNEIESEVAGEVVRIYVENGQPVEYGQSLFAINVSRNK